MAQSEKDISSLSDMNNIIVCEYNTLLCSALDKLKSRNGQRAP